MNPRLRPGRDDTSRGRECLVYQRKCHYLVLSVLFAVSLALLQASYRAEAATDSDILYVKADADEWADCSSWQSACHLQTALGRAFHGDEIWVAEGVHPPDVGTGQIDNDPASSFHLKDGVALYGGFSGDEEERGKRNWRHNVTVLSGDIDGDDSVDASGVVTDVLGIQGANAHAVVTASELTRRTVLDGFTVTAGSDGAVGGGIQCDHASPTISSVVIVGNSSDGGAGMSNLNGSWPVLVDVVFRNNIAVGHGGGMLNIDSSPSLTNVAFEGNGVVHISGGGMANLDSSPTLLNVIFAGNSAWSGGGMSNDESNPTLINVTLTGNRAQSAAGGMDNTESNPVIQNSILWGNECDAWTGASTCAGIGNYESNPTIAYSIVHGSGGSGSGWDAALGSDGGYNLDDDPRFIRNSDLGDDDWWTRWDNDPGDLRLQDGSPAIDVGNNTYVPADSLDLDLDGDVYEPCPMDLTTVPRILYDTVDMGAYEHMRKAVFLPLSVK